MRFFSLIAPLVVALTTLTAAQENPIQYPYNNIKITAGQIMKIKWNPTTSGPVTLTLRSGPSNDLDQGTVIASNIPNTGSTTYLVPKTTPYSAYYTIQIAPASDPSSPNYSATFVIQTPQMAQSLSQASNPATLRVTKTKPAHRMTSAPHAKHRDPARKQDDRLAHHTSTADVAGVTPSAGGMGQAPARDARGGVAAVMALGAGLAFAL